MANDSVKDVIIAVNEFCKFVKGIDDDTFFSERKEVNDNPTRYVCLEENRGEI